MVRVPSLCCLHAIPSCPLVFVSKLGMRNGALGKYHKFYLITHAPLSVIDSRRLGLVLRDWRGSYARMISPMGAQHGQFQKTQHTEYGLICGHM